MKTTGAHFGICISSRERADAIFRDLFEMELVKEMTAPANLINDLFGVEQEMLIIVYDAESVMIEIFITPPRETGFAHLCLTTDDRDKLIERAVQMGLGVRRHRKQDSAEIVFFQDLDGNRYEIKQG